MPKLKTIKQADNCFIQFNEWFDKVYGNTYFDATVYIGNACYRVPYQYGYHAGSPQAIDEALKDCGYRVRACKGDYHRPYRSIRISVRQVKKRDLNKEFKKEQ